MPEEIKTSKITQDDVLLFARLYNFALAALLRIAEASALTIE